jgi:hypothetical protein
MANIFRVNEYAKEASTKYQAVGRILLSACLHGLLFEAKEGSCMFPQASTMLHGVTYQIILTHHSHCCENLKSHEDNWHSFQTN